LLTSLDKSYSILRNGGILVGYGMNLPSLSGSRRPSILPVMLKLLARHLLSWTRKRTTWIGVTRSSKHSKISVPIKGTLNLRDIKAAHREYASSAGMGSIAIKVTPRDQDSFQDPGG
jgi:synaptic vesicle membrane protein VAT-1